MPCEDYYWYKVINISFRISALIIALFDNKKINKKVNITTNNCNNVMHVVSTMYERHQTPSQDWYIRLKHLWAITETPGCHNARISTQVMRHPLRCAQHPYWCPILNRLGHAARFHWIMAMVDMPVIGNRMGFFYRWIQDLFLQWR